MTSSSTPAPQDTNEGENNVPMPVRKATLRLEQRQLTLISGTIVGVIIIILLFVGYSMFLDFKNTRDIIIAEDNLRAIYKAIRGYSLDFDEKLPTADKWTEQVAGYLSAPPGTPGGKYAYLKGEDEQGKPVHYAFNDLVSDYKLEDRYTPEEQRKSLDLSNVILFIEVPGSGENDHVHIPPCNTTAGDEAMAKLLTFPHGNPNSERATTVVMYANGSIKRLTPKDVAPVRPKG